jgi:hypothetical protein
MEIAAGNAAALLGGPAAGNRFRLVRRPHEGFVTPHPGGLGSPSTPTKRGRLQWLDATRTKAGE